MSGGRPPVRKVLVCAVFAFALIGGAGLTPAHAAFPGRNGFIAWTKPTGLTTDSEIFRILPDGSHFHQLSHNDRNDFFPAWSPNGRLVAFESSTATDVDIWV